MTPDELRHMTGADQYNKPQLLKLKNLRLNGDTGKWVLRHDDEPKDENGRYRQSEIEGPLNVVFLKVRRRLFEGSRDGVVGSTNEHNTTNDIVTLYYKGEKVQGIARELRERYENLRTEQIVYVRYKGEIMRLSVKGKSLSGDDETTNFYQYLSAYSSKGEQPWWEHLTRLVPHEGGDGKRSYYFIDFQRGDLLDEAQKEQVFENIRYVHESCTNVDAFYQVSPLATITAGETADDQPVKYPDEDINPEDIPF